MKPFKLDLDERFGFAKKPYWCLSRVLNFSIRIAEALEKKVSLRLLQLISFFFLLFPFLCWTLRNFLFFLRAGERVKGMGNDICPFLMSGCLFERGGWRGFRLREPEGCSGNVWERQA